MNQKFFRLKQDLLALADHRDDLYAINPNNSYFKRFPTCKHVQEFTCADQSCYSKCPEGAYGEKGCQAMAIPWEQCSRCTKYKRK